MFYVKLMSESTNEVFKIFYLSKTGSLRTALIEMNSEEYIDKSQLEYILKIKAKRQLKDFKKPRRKES